MFEALDYDVVIVGAGISGINAAYRIQHELGDLRYIVLENRSELGGTWSLFKYPGIRSDSDLYTFGFPWEPWTENHPIASAPAILSYMKRTVDKHGLMEHIRFNHKVDRLSWSSEQQSWTIDSTCHDGGQSVAAARKVYRAKYVIMATGYYDYEQPLETTIPGLENFQGKVIHPQFWDESYDYSDQNVVVIGSGATAVTLLPAMSEKAKSVTILQRSPSYLLANPIVPPLVPTIKRWLPTSWAIKVIRWRAILNTYLIYWLCQYFPNKARRILQSRVATELPADVPCDPHFIPRYSPWQQRMCITPGGDFFAALRSGKGHVVTDTVNTVESDGILLNSGARLPADLIVPATGLRVEMGGHTKLVVDGKQVNFGDKLAWKGALLQDVPNFIFVFGYTNMSWTLGADATAQLFVRLVKKMRGEKCSSVVPRLASQHPGAAPMQRIPLLNLNSSYVKKAVERGTMPQSGDRGPWAARTSYFRDYWNAKFGDLHQDLAFTRLKAE
ncbi:hypothetical protein H2204_003137 [Knufia peltigerae]|uniref:Uncharacterized protein n=1 Tax=Knufia peltigerae TaxID=1002370 RepID=A0AA39D2C1_9EURO|nr:hypothetical protein H2204_003137 [Knufia peltigerae]